MQCVGYKRYNNKSNACSGGGRVANHLLVFATTPMVDVYGYCYISKRLLQKGTGQYKTCVR